MHETLHRTLQTEQHETRHNLGVSSDAQER